MRLIDTLALLLLAGAPLPAAAEPKQSPIDQAVAARDAGDYNSAIALLEQQKNERPSDTTVLRLLGTSYALAQRYDEAIAVLRQARAIAPADQDIALALARAYLWDGRIEDAARTLAEVEAAAPGHVEMPALRASIADARREQRTRGQRATLSLSQSVGDVGFDRGGGATWYTTSIELALPVPGRTIMTGSIERESRQRTVDTRVALRADRRVGASSSGYIALTATPNADFRERWSVRVGGETALHPQLSATLDLRYLNYASAGVVAVEPGIRFHARDDRWSLAIKSIQLWNDGHRNGWSARGDVDVHRGLRISIGGATYPDTEAGVTRRTRSAFAGLVLDLGERITLRANYEHDRRAQSYNRDAGILSASVRF